jgi:hypothetical protein
MLRQRTPLKPGKGFQRRHEPTVAREDRPRAPLRRLECVPNYSGTTSGEPIEKTRPQRNRMLLDMARDRPCLLLFPWVESHRPDTVVACHSNLAIHGKAGARKADDQYSVWGCAACHALLDQGAVSVEVKRERFMAAMGRQIQHWCRIAEDRAEPLQFRAAARWALERHGENA